MSAPGSGRLIEIALTPDEDLTDSLAQRVAATLSVSKSAKQWVVRTRTVDARHKKVRVRYQVELFDGKSLHADEVDAHFQFGVLASDVTPIYVIGAGPAGMFCAWRLLKLGLPVVVLERGADVRGRRPHLAALNREGVLNTETNYCFGEGGAGTFSDGKLYTRSTKKGSIRDVLEVFVAAGAPERILTDARPHIGTNRLPKVIEAFRNALIEGGAQFRFGQRVTNLVNKTSGIEMHLADGERIRAQSVILATGHSANDTYQMLFQEGVSIEAKPFAMGVRVEHPQALINEIQYGDFAGHPALGAAPYQLRRTVDGIGTFSFCMCPGGFMVASSTANHQVVVNGMSPSRRNSQYANSGLVVSVDAGRFQNQPRLALAFQEELERRAFEAGGGLFRAPAQRLDDFIHNRVSVDLPDCSYRPGLSSCQLSEVLPNDIATHLREGLKFFNKRRLRGYLTNEAVMVGVESRSSAAVRIVRDSATLMSPDMEGLFPCGEGAGYAGGIMSAAIEGIRCADAAARFVKR